MGSGRRKCWPNYIQVAKSVFLVAAFSIISWEIRRFPNKYITWMFS